MNLPNKISIFRLVLIPIIVLVWVLPYAQLGIEMPVYNISYVVLPLKNLICLALFAIASISDFLDGYIARSTNQVTTFGKFVDPIADKCLTTTMFIIFAANSIIPVVPVLVMVWRDVLVDGVRQITAAKNFVMAAGPLGKLKTVLQMFAIIMILLNNIPFELMGLPVADILLWASALVSLISGYDYYKQAKPFIWESK